MPSGGIFDFDTRQEQLTEIRRELEDPDIWNDPEHAQKLGQERARLEAVVDTIVNLDTGIDESGELLLFSSDLVG